MAGFYYPHLSATTVNEYTRECYGTDVPTLARENAHLQYKLQATERDLRRKRAEYRALKDRYRQLQDNYQLVWSQLDRYKEKLREAKARLHWKF